MLSEQQEIAWAAGLFEGEGTAYALKQRGGKCPPSPSLRLVMADRDVVERFARIVGVGHIQANPRKVYSVKHRPQWCWTAHTRFDFDFVMAAFAPYLGERRLAKFEEIAAGTCPAGLTWHERRAWGLEWRETHVV